MSEPTTIAVCALTYLRPDGLSHLLDGLAGLARPAGTEMAVVIVDNDPEGSARAIVEDRATGFPVQLQYVHQPERGISTSRNAAVNAARAVGADQICFIDDDEVPEPEWLLELVDTARTTGADIVTGPVLPVFETPPPKWVVEGAFFERRRHEHHEWIRYATTSSVLIESRALEGRTHPFDRAFNMSGGEDTHLFAELREAGFRSIWCDRAIVHETIPDSRVDERWLLKREYRRGQTLSLSLRRRKPSPLQLIKRVGNGLVQMAAGLGRTIVGMRRGKVGVLLGLQRIVFGAGILTGLAGRKYEEYESTHGS